MEKKQYELVTEVLRRLQEQGVLEKLIIAGSWSLVFYRNYFRDLKFRSSLRTRDLDFLVPAPAKIDRKVNIPALLKDLGFIVEHNRADGYMRLIHPALMMEFLVAERGKGTDKPRRLPGLGINAQPLRYLNYLESKVRLEEWR